LKVIQINPEIIAGCKQKQPKAQEELYRACYTVFMKIAIRYSGSYDDAANILQESFMKIFINIDKFCGSGEFVGWMKRILVNTAIDYIKREKNYSSLNIDQAVSISEDEDAESRFVIDENAMLEAVRELPKMHLLVFNLFVMEEFTHQDIAEKLDITVASSKWYLFDARRILKKKLSVYVNV
jgi:RNA polymerase sigma-70 factor, ECF subfamily